MCGRSQHGNLSLTRCVRSWHHATIDTYHFEGEFALSNRFCSLYLILFLSFFKIPKQVVVLINRIQGNFL